MPLESATYISDLDPSNPVGSSDLVSSLDDHMRLVKATLQTTFPGIAGAVTATHAELNFLDGVTGTTGAGKLVLDDTPTIADLTVTDSITLPSQSIADSALSNKVPLLSRTTWALDGGLTVTPAGTLILGGDADVTVSLRGGGNGAAFQINGGTQEALIRAGGVGAGNTVATFGASAISFAANTSVTGTLESSGNATVARIRTGQGSDASLSSTNHPFQLGLSDGPNLIADINEIMARNNGAAADLAINTDGGNIQLGHSSSTVSVPGALTVAGAATAGTAATSTSATLVAGQIHNRSANTTVDNLGAGRWVAVQNTSTSAITLSQGSGVTLELGGTTTTGNRTLGPKGFAFIYFRANNTATVQGSGVS